MSRRRFGRGSRGGRAKIAAWLNHLLALLPFEPPYFTCHGLQTTFVGHSCLESQPACLDSTECLTALGLEPACSTLAVLPGSRTGELSRIGPIFTQVTHRLHDLYGDKIQIVVPRVDHLSAQVRELVESWPVRTVVCPQADKYKAFAAADVALAASGTATLELAVASVPTVVGYRVHPLSAWIVRRLIRTRYYSLPNILLQRELQPECIQDNCHPDFWSQNSGTFSITHGRVSNPILIAPRFRPCSHPQVRNQARRQQLFCLI